MSQGSADDAARAISALVKSTFLDVELGISAYLDSAEKTRRELEQTRSVAIQNKTAAITALSAAVAELAQGNLRSRLTGEFSSEYQALQNDFNAMATRQARSIEVLVWNYHDDDKEAPDAPVEWTLPLTPGGHR